jgi:MFS family permease
MYSAGTKRGVFVLEGMNAVGHALYFNYLFFFMRDTFSFGNLENLTLCAGNGLVYTAGSLLGGGLVERIGGFRVLRLGFGTMVLGLMTGGLSGGLTGQLVALGVWTAGISLTWPAMEALISAREQPARLSRLVGIYNVVWSGGSALATFGGGAMLDHLGARSIFLVPALIHAGQWWYAGRLSRRAIEEGPGARVAADVGGGIAPVGERRRSPVPPRAFLRMAWLANPFAFMAISALLPVIPRLAERFGLSPTWAGVFASTWFFARSATFVGLWWWSGWHYRFRWLAGSMVALVGSFAAILMGQQLWLFVVAQVVFGAALGLIYYSSLFYSMDVGSESQGLHGGIHEAAIGAGVFMGPAVGAAALGLWPAQPQAHAWGVSGLLLLGLVGVLGIRITTGRRGGSGVPRQRRSGR